MARSYEVLFYNGWQDEPAYYLLDLIEGRTPKAALKTHLPELIGKVRRLFSLDEDFEDDRICETLYAMRSDALIPARRVLEES